MKKENNTNNGIYNKSNINFGSRPDWNKINLDTQSLTLLELNVGTYMTLFQEASEPRSPFRRLWKLPKTKVL
jgi:hypothetical protein